MGPGSLGSRQILDALTAHIALYHSSSRLPTSNPNPRKAILRWFSSLSVHQRQAALTVVDSDFVKILLQMTARLQNNGHGFFFLLPDLPSATDRSVPSLCYRPSRGLLSRASASNESERLISSSVRLFGSREGESGAEFSLDSMMVSEELVVDVERFVAVMDGISDGGFLRDDGSNASQSAWEETEWLKNKGYYSVEAFIVNKLELALRSSWLDCYGGKKQRVAKSKDKARIAAAAANVFWRKKGCLDWWLGLEPGARKKIIVTFLCKGTKSMVNEMIKRQMSALSNGLPSRVGAKQPVRYGYIPPCQRANELCCFIDSDVLSGLVSVSSCRKPCRFVNLLNCLLVLREVSGIVLDSRYVESEKETLFFSALGSVHDISDCILRRVRSFLMSLSMECINVELVGDSKFDKPLNESGDSFTQGCRKGKKNCHNLKRLNSTPKSSRDHRLVSSHIENCMSKAAQGNVPTAKAGQKTIPVGTYLEKSLDKTALETQENAVVADQKVDVRKKKRRKGAKKKRSCWQENCTVEFPEHNCTVENPEHNNMSSRPPFSMVQNDAEKSMQLLNSLTFENMSSSFLVKGNVHQESGNWNTRIADVNYRQGTKADPVPDLASFATCLEYSQNSNKLEADDSFKDFLACPFKDEGLSHEMPLCPDLICETSSSRTAANATTSFVREASNVDVGSKIVESARPEREHETFYPNDEIKHRSSQFMSDGASLLVDSSASLVGASNVHKTNHNESSEYFVHRNASLIGGVSYEWPSTSSVHFPSVHSPNLPAAADRLHLDVGHNWPNHIPQSLFSATPNRQSLNASADGGHCQIVPARTPPMSLDWPLMVKSCSRFSQTVSLNFDTVYSSRLHSPFCAGLNCCKMQGTGNENERYSGDISDFCDFKNPLEAMDDAESYWMSEDESDMHAFSGRDYNQFFGGGVMYWNTSDYVGTSFSRPPSYSSEDSSWAWHEADLNKAIDDMVGMTGLSGSHSTNGVVSPPAAPFCSPFDHLGPGQQVFGHSLTGNDANGLQSPSSAADPAEEKIGVSLSNSGSGTEGVKGDSFQYPVLRPIIIPSISRKGPRSEFKISLDHKSPCLPSTRRDFPRIKRPPSPVVLCVPRAPRPPPPSSVGESRKHRGFPVVRSGSSSPRNWGMRWNHEEHASAGAHICLDGAEVVWTSWENGKRAGIPMVQPVPGSLLQDRLIAISQLSRDQEHPDVAFPVQPPELNCTPHKVSLSMIHSLLHEEIDNFCKKHAARYLANQDWVKNDSLKTIENTAIPLIMLITEVPCDAIDSSGITSISHTPEVQSSLIIDARNCCSPSDSSGTGTFPLPNFNKTVIDGNINVKSIRLDISFKSPTHTGLQTTELVRELTKQFPASMPLALVLKQFLADRSLDCAYSGGLSSYCLVLLIIRFLQHEHHLGRTNSQNLGSLLMDFLYFFGNVFDPRQMRISIQGSGFYMNRERGHSIDPIHIDDPLCPTNNVGKNCFRIHQCIKAFADAYSLMDNQSSSFSGDCDLNMHTPFKLLQKIIPSIDFDCS